MSTSEPEGGVNLDDGVVIERVLAGHTKDYEELVRIYESRVYATCLKATRSSQDAEDLVQEVFLSAFKGLSSFRGDAKFSTWIYQITIRKCLDWRRKAERNRLVLLPGDIPEPTTAHLGSDTPEQRYVERERVGALMNLLRSLPEPYRSTVHMYYVDRQSYQEISQSAGVSVKTVESRLYRARQMLKEKGADWN